MRDIACGFAARFRCGASRLACCAGKRFAFPQLRTLVGSNPSARCPNKNGPLSRTISNSMVGDEGCPRAAGAARFRFGPPALACCAGKRFAFPQLRTLAGSNPFARSSKRKAAIADSLIIHMVGDEGCPRAAGAARFRFGPPALACCAGKRFAFPQLRTLAGSNPFARSSKRKAAIADSLIIHMVGDEGFEPPALCV